MFYLKSSQMAGLLDHVLTPINELISTRFPYINVLIEP